MAMDLPFLPSLERLACERIVTLMLSDADLQWRCRNEYFPIKSKVTEKISQLIPCELLQRKLEDVIAPVMFEVQNWIDFCENNWTGLKVGCFRIEDAIPLSRQRDGTIDKEKFVTVLVKNRDINLLTRFALACTFCRFEDVLDLWNSLPKIEKAYLRNRGLKSYNIKDSFIGHWIEWLESNADRSWKSFVAFAFETPIWKDNIYIMRRVLQTPCPVEKSQYLLKAIRGGQVSHDVMRFCLPMMMLDDREVIFRESPLAVFRCLLSWPLRSVFLDFSIHLWPYITRENFFGMLEIVLRMITDEFYDFEDLIVIVKEFWAQSPDEYKEFVIEDSTLFRSVDFILQYDFAQQFQRRLFFNTFLIR